ncbi:HNH endonuclease family protein [Streptomyces sp. DG2A-72]|uniref:HNH endonuclease family protein n=1 Tax=Streptomyces sp. DG2A-72 TaxID=3051386 RepID=UPI00265C42CE|nr:HNH endonuclease family protein [Streptomyces sp. DG2A-72]MDO0936483.1 HNH endonuclease family protein [Streptomyces sp. DG2A-72]
MKLSNHLLRAGLVAITSLAVTAPTAHAEETLPLHSAVAALPVADEDRTGYDRDLFNHWIDADRDGCSTRSEVLLDEATIAPEVTGRCTLTGGQWYSWYDNQYVTGARGLDIDHLVPLAEAWDSGASAWSAQRREQYANDLGDERALVAVTARSNRQKADQDPATWLPDTTVVCRYVADWTVIKLRWALTVDTTEQQTLTDLAADCPNTPVTYTPAG